MTCSPQQALNPTRNPAARPRRILVIDDDPCVAAAIQSIMSSRRIETVHAARATEGIHALRQSVFDLAVVDLFLPGLNGLEAIEFIRRDSTIPIIAMSGFRLKSSAESIDYLEMAEQRGATLCMRKPFKVDELIEAIDAVSGPRP